jgi:hypothetical protein
MRAAKPIDPAQTATAMRDRVTVDLRGIRPQLQAQAAKRQMTAAALVQRAVTAMLDDAPCDAGESGSIDSTSGIPVVKVTLRLPVAHAVLLASRARVADVSQGMYVARLIDGTPAQPRAPDHTQAVAALMASTDRLAALGADLNAFIRLLARVSQLAPHTTAKLKGPPAAQRDVWLLDQLWCNDVFDVHGNSCHGNDRPLRARRDDEPHRPDAIVQDDRVIALSSDGSFHVGGPKMEDRAAST